MSQWGKSSKNLAAPAAAVGEVPVQKVEKIELNLVSTKFRPVGEVCCCLGRGLPIRLPVDGYGKPYSPRSDDINLEASKFIDDTKKRWNLGHKSVGATGRR